MIRKAKLSDIAQILEIENQSFGADRFNRRQFIYLITKAKGLFLVIENADKILAYISLTDNYRYSFTRLYSIAVHPEARGQKLSEILMERTIEYAEKKHFNYIRLEVRKNNSPAVNLYQKFDFKPVGVKKNYYHDGSDAIVMIKRLREA
ncbi:MAG: ribosomal protein S18-alanine N-acetyltransferase [Tannerella sp.]|jgi:ribosomal-protein-alanine acetyltransferase|nr:ribosomal protein S18-alanine N-acetyltransferase [Tannerella sp.]